MAAMVVAAVACNETPTAPSRQDLSGRWTVSSLQPANAAVVTPQGGVVLAMDFADDRVFVQSDCNTCSGPYTLTGTSIAMPNLACTRRACLGTNYEDLFLDLISTTQTADMVPGESLALVGPRGRIVLRR
jgi:heat shock protein HslJ